MIPGRDIQAQQACPGLSLLQANDSRQSAGAPGTRPSAPDNLDSVQALHRNGGPDHPASKGVVERSAFEKHQGPTGA